MVPGGAGDGPARVGTAFAMRNTDRFDADILHVLGPDSSVAELRIVNPTVGGPIPSQGVQSTDYLKRVGDASSILAQSFGIGSSTGKEERLGFESRRAARVPIDSSIGESTPQ